MTRIAVHMALRAGLVAATFASPAIADAHALDAASHNRPACQEDEPCWSWSAMGNRQRGVITTSGKRAIVTCARYRRLDRRNRIDHAATKNLRGDGRCRSNNR